MIKNSFRNKKQSIVGIIIILTIAVGILYFTYKSIYPPIEYKYSVVDKKQFSNKQIINVTIDSMVDSTVLIEIANKIADKEFDKSEKHHVFFKIANVEPQEIGWARVDFEPEPKIGYISMTSFERHEINKNTKNLSGKVLVAWSGGMENKNYALKDSSGFLLLKSIYSDGEITDTVSASKAGGTTRIDYKNKDMFGEHFKVNENNDLEFYNNENKLFKTCKRIM